MSRGFLFIFTERNCIYNALNIIFIDKYLKCYKYFSGENNRKNLLQYTEDPINSSHGKQMNINSTPTIKNANLTTVIKVGTKNPAKSKASSEMAFSNSLVSAVTRATLNSMSTDELRALAKRLEIKVGKSRNNTIENLMLASSSSILHTKVKVSFCKKPADPSHYRVAIFGKKFSTAKPPSIFQKIL